MTVGAVDAAVIVVDAVMVELGLVGAESSSMSVTAATAKWGGGGRGGIGLLELARYSEQEPKTWHTSTVALASSGSFFSATTLTSGDCLIPVTALVLPPSSSSPLPFMLLSVIGSSLVRLMDLLILA